MFTDMPLVCTDNPEKISSPAMWSSAKGGGGGSTRENPAASPAVLAGEGAGKVLGVVHDRFGYGFGAEGPPVSKHGGGQRRSPWARMLR
jgi:hypothetical protein